jgi:hypothetical protein
MRLTALKLIDAESFDIKLKKAKLRVSNSLKKNKDTSKFYRASLKNEFVVNSSISFLFLP